MQRYADDKSYNALQVNHLPGDDLAVNNVSEKNAEKCAGDIDGIDIHYCD